MEKIDDLTLSYSSANLLRSCARKYYHHKVAKTPLDSDYDDDSEALVIGKSLHFILESTKHSKPEKIDEFLKLCTDNFKLSEDNYALVHAMTLKYLRLHKASGLECVSVEDRISNEYLTGFVDAILRDKKGNWVLMDLKTASTLNQTLVARLPNDTQLNLYSYFAPELAKRHKLDLKKFKGCHYRVITKSKAAPRAGEDRLKFTARILELIKGYDIFIPIEKMNPEKFMGEHRRLWDESMLIRDSNEACQNFTACESFYRPCQFFSQCHGKNFSELKEALKIVAV